MIVDISDHLPPVKVEPNAPVKVEPSWESTNKELEFTGADGQELNAPVDRYLTLRSSHLSSCSSYNSSTVNVIRLS